MRQAKLYQKEACLYCGKKIEWRAYRRPFCSLDCRNVGTFYNPRQGKATAMVGKAIKDGKLPRITSETKCVDCTKQAKVYDHRDYRKPLDVVPVCMSCNFKRGMSVDRLILDDNPA